MNEEALQQLYSLAKGEGYSKSFDEFKILIGSNEEALSNMYSVAQNEGYKKSIDDFKTLVGFGGSEIDSELKKKEDTVSVSEDGSSDLRDTRKLDYERVEEPSAAKDAYYTGLAAVLGGPIGAAIVGADAIASYGEDQEAYERQQKDEEYTQGLVEEEAAKILPERETLAPVSELMPRVGEMEQPDGRTSTHLMRREYIAEDGVWVAFPSLFQNEDGTWVDMSEQAEEAWEPVFEEAKRRGEVMYFGDDEMAATEFADDGSWKKRYTEDVKQANRVREWEEDSDADKNWKYTTENKDQLLEDVKKRSSSFGQASKELRDDKDFMLEAISLNPSAIKYASPRLRDDEIFIREAIKISPESVELITDNATLRLQDKLKYVGTPLDVTADNQFDRNISNITGDLINKEEEFVVPKLNYQLSQYGFTFEESGMGDSMTVTASNGQEITVSLNNEKEAIGGGDFAWQAKNDAEATMLKNWLKENKVENPDLQSLADNQLRILGEEEVMAAVKGFNEETEEFQQKLKTLTSSYTDNVAIIQSLTMEGKTNTPEYKEALKKNQQLLAQSKRLQEDEEYFKIQGARLDLQVGKYAEMQAKQGTFSGALWNKFIHGTVAPSKAAVRMMTSIGTSPIFESKFHVRDNIVAPAKEILTEAGITIPENLLEMGNDGQYVREDELLEFIKKTKVSNIPKELLPYGKNLVDALDEKYEDTITKDVLYGSPTYRNPYSGKASTTDLDKSGIIDAIDEGHRMYYTAGNTTEQFEALKSEGFWGGALLGLAESLPAMVGGRGIGGIAQRTAQMYALSTEHVYDEMEKDPDFDNISEDEKFYVTAPIGVTVGVLEAIGVRNALRGNAVVLNLANRALGKSTSKTTAKTFAEFVRKDVDGMLKKGILTITAGGIAEFETGLTQEMAEIGVKAIYNNAKDKNMFQTPDTWDEYVTQVLRAGAQEMIGGFIMGSIPATVNAYKNGTLAELDDTVWEVFKEMAADENYKKMSMTDLKNKILSGDYTVEQAKEIEAAYNELLGIMPSITTDLSTKRQKQAVQLLLQRQKLKSEIEGKAPLLVRGKNKKIKQIEEQITELETEQLEENKQQKQIEEGIDEFGVSSKTQEQTTEDDVTEDAITEDDQGDIEEFFGEETEESTETVEENLSINKKGGISYTPEQKDLRNQAVRAARRAARAISKILPNTRIVLHESNDEYLKYTKGKKGRGEYIDDVVHINLSLVNDSTVGHEVFHAVFLDKLKTDERAARAAARMIVAVGKSLSKSSPLRKNIEAFAANYTGDQEILQNEEMLAELVGILSQVKGKYKELSKPSKSKVVEFLRKIAKSLGIENLLGPEFGKTDESVIDLLNTLSKKIREGEVIEESEVQVLESGELIKEADGPIPNNIEDDGPSIDLKASRQQQVDRGGVDLSSIKRGSINDLSGANAFVFAADQATYGKILSPSGLEFDFFGGYLYPYGNGFGWAFTEEVAAKKVLSKVKESDGVGLVMSQAPDGITGSFRLFEYLNAEITHAINKGANPKELLDYVNQKLRLTKVAQGLKNKGIPSQISSIEELALLMPYEGEQKISYEVRGEFAKTFFSAESANKFGIPPLNPTAKHDVGVLDYVNDPSLKNVEYGDIVSAIQFDKNSPIREVREGEPNFHPSYPFVINGTPIMIFNNAVDVRKVYPNAKPKSPKANQTPLGKRKKSAAARSAMGGQYVAQVPSEIDVKDSQINVSRQQKLAPNGKPSKLSPEQYNLVRTPAFKKWFGDWETDPENASKAVDENGEPLVVYHGGPIIKGDSFRKGYADGNLRGDKGIYFTENKEFAKYFAHQNELVERDKRNFEYDDIPESELETGEPFNEKYFKYSEIYPVFLNLKKPTISETGNANLIPRLYEEGADGFITKSTSDFGYDAGQYIAFEPNQIKLADGSNKTFDPSKPSIRQQKNLAPNGKPSKLSPEQYNLVRTPAFKKWFGDWEADPENASKVLDENGEPLVINRIEVMGGIREQVGRTDRSAQGVYSSSQPLANLKDIFDPENKERSFSGFANMRSPLVMEGTYYFDKTTKKPVQITSDLNSEDLIYMKSISSQDLKLLKDLGYDGVWANKNDTPQARIDEIIAFTPKQFKLEEVKDTPAASTSPRQQTVQSLAQIYGMNNDGFFPRTTTMFQVQKAFKKYGLGVKKSRDDGYERGGGLYLTRNGRMYNPFENAPLRPRQQKPIDEYISEARDANFRDNVIRDFLLRTKKFEAKDIKAALEVSRDMFEKLPDSFKNIEGGVKEGEKLYKKIEAHRRKLEKNNAKRTAWKSDAEIKLMVGKEAKKLRSTYDTQKEIDDKVKKKREQLRKKGLKRAEVKKKADTYKDSLEKKRDEKKAAVAEKINKLEANEIRKNKNRQQPLSDQEIMDKLIEFMQEQEAYIKEGDTYTEKGKTKYRKGQSTQQARMMAELQSNVGIRPTQDMAAKVRRARRAVRERMKGKRDLQAIKRALRNFMRVSLPADLYTKSEVMKLIRKITDANENNIDNLMREVEEFVITKNVQRLEKQIKDILEGKYTETVSGRKKGVKIDLATMEQIEFINELLYDPVAKINREVKNFRKKLEKENLSTEEIKEKVSEFRKKLKEEEATAKNIADVNAKLQARWNELSKNPNATIEEQKEMVNLQMAIELNNSVLMENNDTHKVATLDMVYTTLSEMIEFGRSALQEELAEQKAEYDRQFEIAYKEITGNDIDMSNKEEAKEQLDNEKIERENEESQKATDGRVKAFGRSVLRFFDGVFTRAEALDGLMDKISMMAGELFGGPLQDDVVTVRVDESSRKFKARRMFVELQVSNKLEEIYGKNWQKKIRENRVANVEIKFDEEAIKALEEVYKANPTRQTKKLLADIRKKKSRIYSQDELYYLYNQYKDPANEGSFEATFGSNYESIMDQITESMTDEVKAFADWQVDEFFPSLYEHYNETYKAIYRTNMPWNERYAGRIFREGVTPEPLDLLSGSANFNNSVNGASTRARIENNKPIRGMNGTDALMSYINDMEYFAAYAETVRDLDKLFTNMYIQNAIETKFGKKTFELIKTMIQKIANKGVRDESYASVVNTMNNAFILSRLGLNPVVMIKQLTSTFTYANDIGIRNWTKYSAKSIPELKKVWAEIRENSVYLQDRKYNGIMKAIESYSETTMKEFVPKPTQNFMANVLMSMVKFGDRSAIYLGGTANYMFYKDQALKQGKTEQEAIDIAIRKFERDTKRTQQSSDLQDRDYWQTANPIARALNMFMTTPKQYLRKEIQAFRSLNRKLLAWDKSAGKGTIGQNVRTLAMYHVFMPVLFQYVAMGMPALFRPWRDDDEDDLIRAALIGNLNALFIGGEIVAAIGDYFQGKPWAGESQKTVGALTTAASIIQKLKKADRIKDPQKRADAMTKAYLEMATIAAIPAPTLAKFADNYDKIISGETDDMGELILRLFNYSEYQISGPKGGQDKSTGKSIQEMYEDYNRQLRKEEQERKRQEKLLKSLYDEDRGGDRSRGTDRNSGSKRGSSRGNYKR